MCCKNQDPMANKTLTLSQLTSEDIRLCLAAHDLLTIITELKNIVRNKLKHEDLDEKENEVYCYIRNLLIELIADRDIGDLF